jgi:hypothetical protein
MGVTFVTALFYSKDLGYRKLPTYLALFDNLASTGIPIILYLDSFLKEEGNILSEKYKNIQRIIYVDLDTSYLMPNMVLPSKRYEEKDKLEYFCIQLSKFKLLEDAEKYVTTTHTAWIDFGVYHMLKDYEICRYWLNKIAHSEFYNEKILSPGCRRGYVDEVWDKVCWNHCGSFLLGPKDKFQGAHDTQMKLVKNNLPRITWEINYWTMMEEHFSHYFVITHGELLFEKVCDYICP